MTLVALHHPEVGAGVFAFCRRQQKKTCAMPEKTLSSGAMGGGSDLYFLEIVIVISFSIIASTLLSFFLTRHVIKRFIWRRFPIHRALYGLMHVMLEAILAFVLLEILKKLIPLGLLSFEDCAKVHIFIFMFGVAHVFLRYLTLRLAVTKVQRCKDWEDKVLDIEENDPEDSVEDQEDFIYKLMGNVINSRILSLLSSCAKQFYGPLTKTDYIRMRHIFIMENGKNHREFYFCEYLVHALNAQFEKLEGTSFVIQVLVGCSLWLGLHGWTVCFWLAFILFIFSVVTGAKLEQSMALLSHEATEKLPPIGGNLFYFGQTRLGRDLIYAIIFHSAFMLAFLFWVLAFHGFQFRLEAQRWYILPWILTSVASQILCSYSTLHLYIVIDQVGTSNGRKFAKRPWELIKRMMGLV